MATSAEKILIRLTKFSGKVSKVIDVTSSFNITGTYFQDLSGWDVAVVQIVNSDGAIYFKTTNDDNSLIGDLLPAPEQPNNWNSVLGIDLSTKTDVDNINGSGIVEFGIIGKYLQLYGDSVDTQKSFPYFLSYFSYENINDSYNTGISQGSMIVYSDTDQIYSISKFFTDSKLTQPFYGNNNWYAFKLMYDNNTLYVATINQQGTVSVD